MSYLLNTTLIELALPLSLAAGGMSSNSLAENREHTCPIWQLYMHGVTPMLWTSSQVVSGDIACNCSMIDALHWTQPKIVQKGMRYAEAAHALVAAPEQLQ